MNYIQSGLNVRIGSVKKEIVVILLIFLATTIFWRGAFFNFFAQDDFILASQFSQNDLLSDLVNVFGKPEVTHWRPMHNFYFFVAGNLFGRAHYLYHTLTLFVHVGTSFLIYKILVKIWRSFYPAFGASLIYAIHPAHFVAIYWISGSAVNIGFFFLLLSFYLYLKGLKFVSLPLYFLALLGSEAMVAGASLFVLSSFLGKGLKFDGKFLLAISVTTLVFLMVKLAYTSSATLTIYRPEISSGTFFALYYYILRILGFAETSGDLVLSALLVIFLLFVIRRVLIYIRELVSRGLEIRWDREKLILPLSSFAGLFPFVLLPTHLSPHYMVLPIFGFSQLLALGLCRFSKMLVTCGLLLFALISLLNIEVTGKNHWVVERGNLARGYLQDLEEKNLESGSTIVVNSKEEYIALGTGKAIRFWFPDNNYKTCFAEFENCFDFD